MLYTGSLAILKSANIKHNARTGGWGKHYTEKYPTTSPQKNHLFKKSSAPTSYFNRAKRAESH